MPSEWPATPNDVHFLEVIHDDHEVRNTGTSVPHALLALVQRNAGIHADVGHGIKIDLGQPVAEPSPEHAHIGLDSELLVANNTELPRQPGRAERGVAAEVRATAIGVQVDQLHGRTAVGRLEKDDAIRSYAGAAMTDSAYDVR